jgi:hypothetical protein
MLRRPTYYYVKHSGGYVKKYLRRGRVHGPAASDKGYDVLGAGARDAITQALALVLLRNIVMVEVVDLFSAP